MSKAMTKQEEQALVLEIQSNKALNGAGVVLVENSGPKVLSWPDSNRYFLIYRLDLSCRDQQPLEWRQNILRHLSSLGIIGVKTLFLGVLRETYACFLCERAGSVNQFDSQINTMMNNNLSFLALQTKVQNVSQISQLMSNIAKADSDAKLNAVRNIRS